VVFICAEKTDIIMGLNAGQQKQAMEMKMFLNITFEAK